MAARHTHETGSFQPGAAHPRANFTEEDVRSIRWVYSTGNFTHKKLAERYGVDVSTIQKIIARKTWANLT